MKESFLGHKRKLEKIMLVLRKLMVAFAIQFLFVKKFQALIDILTVLTVRV